MIVYVNQKPGSRANGHRANYNQTFPLIAA